MNSVISLNATYNTFSSLIMRELMLMLTERSRMLGIVAQPFLFWIIIGSGFVPTFKITQNAGVGYLEFFYPGVLAMVILFSSIFGTIGLIEDRNSGFLQLVLAGPGGTLGMILGKVLGVSVVALIQASLFLIIAPFFGLNLTNINIIYLFGILFIGSYALASLGFVFAWAVESAAAYHALMSIILIPMWIVSGAMFPSVGTWMESISYINPVSWLVTGVRGVLNSSLSLEGIAPPSLTFGMCLFLLGCFSITMTLLSVVICSRRK